MYAFNGKDGYAPTAGLTLDTAGNLYGTTGGTVYGEGHEGTVFELKRGGKGNWTHKVLHQFGQGTDGQIPLGGIVFDFAGNLYTTTSVGGTEGYGAVVELLPGSRGHWTEKVLHNFVNDGVDGTFPESGVIVDSAGKLYGTTTMGGSGNGCSRQFGLCGVAFELRPRSNGKWTEEVLHSFLPTGSDGIGPSDSLIFDTAGNLYGTACCGGTSGLYGTVFEIIRASIGSRPPAARLLD